MSRDRILICLEHTGNRRLLAEWLRAGYEPILGDGPERLGEPFDLCITDGVTLARLGELVRARKDRDHPVFLPFLLITPRHDVGVATHRLWQVVDELIATPVEKVELRARVEILLRVRRLSQQNVELRRQLEGELAHASRVQMALLPERPPELSGFELAARCVPAREVGGDFYDWNETGPGVWSFTLGDVSGKGMPAALLMATIRATLRAVARQNAPAATAEIVSRALTADLERSGSFVTLFHGQLDVERRRLTYVDAGHGHVFLRRAEGTVEALAAGGLPLGPFPEEGYSDGEVNLEPEDALILYSDGLVDACRGRDASPAVLAERVSGAASAQEMVDRLAAIPGAPRRLPDDLTIVVLRRRS